MLWSTLNFLVLHGFSSGSVVKNSSADAGDTRDTGLIPGLGRSPGEGNGNPLQYSCLEIPWTEEPGGLQSTRPQRVGHDWVHTCMCMHLSAHAHAHARAHTHTHTHVRARTHTAASSDTGHTTSGFLSWMIPASIIEALSWLQAHLETVWL